MPRLTPKAKKLIDSLPELSSRTVKQIILDQLNEYYSHVTINAYRKKNQKSKPTLDTQILMKMIPAFARSGIKINFESDEISRIKELAKEVL